MNKEITLSIIIPTIGRTKEFDELLATIQVAEGLGNFEILVVDQNKKPILDDIVAKYGQLPIQHFKVDFNGLSKAKNYGVEHSKGAWICFPDDDCRIFKDTFSKGFQLIKENSLDMVFGKCVDDNGDDSVLNFKKEAYYLDKDNMLGGFVEATVIAKKEILERWKFDEEMGAGMFFGAEEGYDWLYRILHENKDVKVMFSPEIIFFHPQVIMSKGNWASMNRVFKYRCGTAYLCVKHGFSTKYYKRLLFCLMGCFVYIFTDKKKYNYYKVEVLSLMLGKIFANVKKEEDWKNRL